MNYPCVLCGRHFGSAAAAQQHQRDSPSHATSSSIEMLNHSSGSGVPPQQIRHDSPTEVEGKAPVQSKSNTCSICKRTFGSGKALNQHRTNLHKIVKTAKEPAKSGTETSPSSQNLGLSLAASRSVENDVSVLMSFLNLQQQASARPSKQNASRAQSAQKTKKKTSLSPGEETRIYFKFRDLHPRVEQAVLPDIRSTRFHSHDRNERSQEEYSTFVMGTFACKNEACKKKEWSSGKVTIVIKGYAQNGYSATVYNQRCKACNHLGTFELDEQSYVDRVAYRLKRWAGVMVAQPDYDRKEMPPHESRFCEGCKQGVCGEMNCFRY